MEMKKKRSDLFGIGEMKQVVRVEVKKIITWRVTFVYIETSIFHLITLRQTKTKMGVCAAEKANEIKKTYPNGLRLNSKGQKYSRIKSNPCQNQSQLRQDLQSCFNKFDLNGDGYLDLPELIELVKVVYMKTEGSKKTREFYRQAASDLLQRADYGSQGKVSRSDFYRFYKDY